MRLFSECIHRQEQRSVYMCLAAGLCLSFSVPRAAVSAEAPGPVSVSIAYVTSDIENMAELYYGNTKLLGTSSQIITELSRDYDCRVNLRVNGIDIAAEQALGSLKDIRTVAPGEVRLAVSDYVIGVHTISGRAGVDPILGDVSCVSTHTSDTNAIKRRLFSARSIGGIAGEAAKAVAELLSLKKLQGGDAVESGTASNHMWAVLPFASVNKKDQAGVAAELSMKVELALQEKVGAGRLVERQALEKVLREHQMGAVHSSADIQHLARMMNADRFVIGQVAHWDRGLRVDVNVVDAGTATIVASRSVENVTDQSLNAKVVECVLAAVRASSAAAPLPLGSMEKRRREAEWFVSKAFFPPGSPDCGGSNRSCLDYISAVDRVEGAYLLVHDDPAFTYRIMTDLAIKVDDASRTMYWMYKGMNATKRAAALINYATGSMQSNAQTPSPLLLQASVLVSLLEFDKAIPLIEKHMAEHPGVDLCDALVLKANCASRYDKGAWVVRKVYGDLKQMEECMAIFREAEKTGQETKLSSFTLQHWIADRAAVKEEIEKTRAVVEAKKLSEEDEYEACRKLFSDSSVGNVDYKHWTRYLELLEKRERPEVIARLSAHELQGVPDDVVCFVENVKIGGPDDLPPGRAVLDFWFLQAKSYLAMGKTDEAVRRLRDVEYCGTTKKCFHYRRYDEIAGAARKLADSIEVKSGPVKSLWKTGAQVIPDPPKYSIYLLPALPINERLMSVISSNLHEFFGMNVKLLPGYQVQPEDKRSGGELEVVGDDFLKNAIVKTPIPDDALWVVVLPGMSLKKGVHTARELLGSATGGDYLDNPAIVSTWHPKLAHTPDQAQFFVYAQGVTVSFLRGFQCLYAWSPELAHGSPWASFGYWPNHAKRCYNTPCIYSSACNGGMLGALRFAMCPECQEVYRKADFDAIHKNLMKAVLAMGGEIVKAGK